MKICLAVFTLVGFGMRPCHTQTLRLAEQMLQFYHARQAEYWALGEIFSLDNNPLPLRGKAKTGHVSRQPCSRERLSAKLWRLPRVGFSATAHVFTPVIQYLDKALHNLQSRFQHILLPPQEIRHLQPIYWGHVGSRT